MLSPRVDLTFVTTGVTAILILVIGATPVIAGNDAANYNFLIASGFLCDPNDSTTCPAVARAVSGDAVELSGAGTLSLANKSVTATGAFTHKSPTGEIVATGVWTATELLSFKSYGIAPGALMRESQHFKPSRYSLSVLGVLAGPMPAGGLALIRIRLLPDVGTPKEAVLQVNCAKGKVPDNQQGDGVRLAIEQDGPKFDQKVSGRTVLLLRKPGLNFGLKAPSPGTDSNRTPFGLPQ
jgi:hypothetical protein